jgi:hypothetical protein
VKNGCYRYRPSFEVVYWEQTMRFRFPHNPVLFAFLACACPMLCGCFAMGWAYPTASFTPSICIGPEAQDVRAFRFDVRDDASSYEGFEHDRYVMREMNVRFGDRLAPQGKVAIDYGWATISAISYGQATHHTLLVRLYRPGYRTIEIESWQLAPDVKWVKTESLVDREKAIDDLLTTFERDFSSHLRSHANERPRDSKVFSCLASGSADEQHRAALLFAASEYELLARGDVSDADRNFVARVSEKARTLRKLAAE